MTTRREATRNGAIVLFLVPSGLYALFSSLDTLSCDRDAGACVVTHARVARAATTSFHVDDLQSAFVETIESGEPNGTRTHRLMLRTKQGNVPLTLGGDSFGDTEKEAQVDTIRQYVSNASIKRLYIKHDNRLILVVILLIPTLIGFRLLTASSKASEGQSP